jgi:hypothetical protein
VRHEGTAQAIIDLFDPHEDAPRSQLQTSLHRLSRMLDVDVESAREGVVNLLLDGDFTAPPACPTCGNRPADARELQLHRVSSYPSSQCSGSPATAGSNTPAPGTAATTPTD